MIRWLVAPIAALAPARYWQRLDVHVPATAAALRSAVLTMVAAAAVGIPGFFEHAQHQAHMTTGAILRIAERQAAGAGRRGEPGVTLAPASGFTGLALFTFLLLTPTGWLALYLGVSGSIRSLAAITDDPRGDPFLGGIDAVARRLRRRSIDARERRTRDRLSGPAVPDRLVTGAAAGWPACDLVLIASRPKPGWEPGTVLVTSDKWYRIGSSEARTIAGRLRTLYPLTEHADLEAVRKWVREELPHRESTSIPSR